jgi:histidyl-tRNA synthetase
MLAKAGLTEEQVERVFRFLELQGPPNEVLTRLETMFTGLEVGLKGIEEMRTLLSLVDAAGVPAEHIHLDLSIARGLDYYTGTVFETFLGDLPHLGSVMSGGRYDGLIGFFSGKNLPAVGISVGLDRLFSGLEELGLVPKVGSTAEVLVTQFDASMTGEYLRLCGALRAVGLRVELYHTADKIGKQLQYADRRGIDWAVIVGPDDIARKVAQVKTLSQKQQQEVPLDDLPAWLLKTVRNPTP